MRALSRTQKIILIVMAILDVLVIAGLLGVALVTIARQAASPAPVTQESPASPEDPATWTPTVTLTPRPTLPPRLTNTPRPTATLPPTNTPVPPTSTPAPLPPSPFLISGGDFDFLLPNRIPGWTWDAYVNWRPGDESYNPDSSYAEPMFTAADDPMRRINGSTLKIETVRWLKFRTWVHQTVTVTAGSRVYFQIKAGAYSSLDRLIVNAGIDATGGDSCANASWGNEMRINQNDGIVTLKSPTVVVRAIPQEGVIGEEGTTQPIGRVTFCFFAEPTYADVNNAAFFDQAELIVALAR